MSALTNNIRYMRLLRNLSQKELAEKLNKSTNAVANWERGINSPDVDTLETICHVLRITPNQIYGWDPCKELEDYLQKRDIMCQEYNELLQQREEIEARIKEYSKFFKGREQ